MWPCSECIPPSSIMPSSGSLASIRVAQGRMDELAEKGYYKQRAARKILKNGRTRTGSISSYYNMAGSYSISPITWAFTPGGMICQWRTHLCLYCLHATEGFSTTRLTCSLQRILVYTNWISPVSGDWVILRCLELIKENHGRDINIHEIEKFKRWGDPPATRTSHTIGCFMLNPRPCATWSKNWTVMIPWNPRRGQLHHPAGVGRSGAWMNMCFVITILKKSNTCIRDWNCILKETKGVMIYRAGYPNAWMGGLDMADADLLRRATSFKYRSKIDILSRKINSPTGPFSGIHYRQLRRFGSKSKAADFSFCRPIHKLPCGGVTRASSQPIFPWSSWWPWLKISVVSIAVNVFLWIDEAGARVYPPCVNQSMYQTHIRGQDVCRVYSYQRPGGCPDWKNDFGEGTAWGIPPPGRFIERTHIGLNNWISWSGSGFPVYG